MAIQFLPLIKVVAPYIAQVAAAAIPAFTAKPDTAKSDPVVAKQIEELQAAATQNAESIHLLAEQIQQIMLGIEEAAREAERQAATWKGLVMASVAISSVSLLTCLYLLLA